MWPIFNCVSGQGLDPLENEKNDLKLLEIHNRNLLCKNYVMTILKKMSGGFVACNKFTIVTQKIDIHCEIKYKHYTATCYQAVLRHERVAPFLMHETVATHSAASGSFMQIYSWHTTAFAGVFGSFVEVSPCHTDRCFLSLKSSLVAQDVTWCSWTGGRSVWVNARETCHQSAASDEEEHKERAPSEP